jgi:hypothetical protein
MTCCHDHLNSVPTAQLHSHRAIITTLASAAVLPAGHLVAATNASADDERFMRIALDEAQQADFPFGAVVVRDGQIICTRAQSWKDERRPNRARRDDGDTPLPRRPRERCPSRQHALHFR